MHDLFFGNIAQQVAAASGTPVMLIKPAESPTPFKIKRILVPLDNESVHDKAIPIATQLAKAFKAQLDLLCVIPTLGTLSGEQAASGNLMPATTLGIPGYHRRDRAGSISRPISMNSTKWDLSATAEIARGDPATVISKTAENNGANLIIFGTHGRVGLDAFWNRSVTAGVARRTQIPLLLIPLSE